MKMNHKHLFLQIQSIVMTKLVDPSQELVDPSQQLIDPSQELVDPSEKLVDPSQKLVDLVDPSQELVVNQEQEVSRPDDGAQLPSTGGGGVGGGCLRFCFAEAEDSPHDDWWEKYAPLDLPMPLPVGEKRPMYSHASGQWSRRKLREFEKLGKKHDMGILLHDLCVVDVDSTEIADELEKAFPVLETTPCEQTPRGRHYWFKRSPLCDENEFTDGANQVIEGVDFKTISSRGTGGLVKVCYEPYSGPAGKNPEKRKWIRPLPEGHLDEIPDDLLRAIAVQKKVPEFTFAFEDTIATISIEESELAHFSYFEPFLDDSFASQEIPMPCEYLEFKDLLHSLEKRESTNATAQRNALIADRLGAKKATYQFFAAHALYWHDMDPDMALALSSDSIAIPVPPEVVYNGPPSYSPSAHLFAAAKPSIAIPYPTIFTPDEDEELIPIEVRSFMMTHKVVLAGGAVLGILSSVLPTGQSVFHPGHDWDLFVYGVDEEGADEILASAERHFAGWRRFQTSRAVTFSRNESDLIVQIVLRRYERPEDVPCSFDIAPCKVATWYELDKFVYFCAPSFLVAVKQAAFPVAPESWSSGSVARVLKYCAKGFSPYLPGLRRSCRNSSLHGVSGLVYAEQQIGNRRPSPDNIQSVIYDLRGSKSGYSEDAMKPVRKFFHVIKCLVKKGITAIKTSLGLATPCLDLVLWHAPKQSAIFRKEKPLLEDMYNDSYWTLVAAECDLPTPSDENELFLARLKEAEELDYHYLANPKNRKKVFMTLMDDEQVKKELVHTESPDLESYLERSRRLKKIVDSFSFFIDQDKTWRAFAEKRHSGKIVEGIEELADPRVMRIHVADVVRSNIKMVYSKKRGEKILEHVEEIVEKVMIGGWQKGVRLACSFI